MSGNSLENVNESLIRSRTLMICESYAEKSRSEQMKCLQIWRNGSYTRNLSAGWLHLDIYHAIIVGWRKRKKATHRWNFVTKASKSWKYKAKSGATVCVSERTQHRDRLDNSVSASHLVVPGSIMKQRISRLERVSEGLWSDPLSSWVRVLRVLSGQVLNALGDENSRRREKEQYQNDKNTENRSYKKKTEPVKR